MGSRRGCSSFFVPWEWTFFAALRIALLNCTALWFMFSSDSCSPVHSSSSSCLKLSPLCPLVVPDRSSFGGAHWHFMVFKYGDRSMVSSTQPRANFTVAELVNVVSCKCQIRRACGSPASGVESGRVLWLIYQYHLLVGSPAFHFFLLCCLDHRIPSWENG